MAREGRQVAALPLRRGAEGGQEVLLVTSRETRRWVVPKGWPMMGLADHEAAAREAWEEAGVRGEPGQDVIGLFSYPKMKDGRSEIVQVSVYRLDVTEVSETWPEAHERRREWFSLADAARAVGEPELSSLLLSLAGA